MHGRGQTLRGQHLALKYAYNKRRKDYRVAVVVSKKVAKSAVTRNRIRRRLYEIVRKNDHLISTPLDVVILVYSETVATMPSEKLEAQITSLLQKTTNQTHS